MMSSQAFNTSFGLNPAYSNAKEVAASNSTSEYKKIFCAYHATEFLTNFCIEKECLMPLCPSCVVQHTEEHYQCQQKPTYVNLQEALYETKQKCYSNIITLEEFGKKNTELYNYIMGLPDYVHKQLQQCKQKVFLEVENLFDQYEQKLLSQIQKKYVSEEVYNIKQSSEVKQYISDQIDSLYDKISQIKGDQCLAALIRYYENDEKTYDDEISEINSYIERNKKAGGLYISLNQQKLINSFNGFCENLITVEYIQEAEPSQQEISSTQQLGSIKKNAMASSVVNRVSSSGSGIKIAPNSSSNTKNKKIFLSNQKSLNQGGAYSNQKQVKQVEKDYYQSPF